MTFVGLVLVGLLAGSLAATLGVGGGVVYVPALAGVFALAQHQAQGTSLAVIVPTTLIAALVHAKEGRVDWRTAALVAIGGVAGGIAGAQLALALEGAVLKRLYGAFLVFVAVRMLGRTRRSAHE